MSFHPNTHSSHKCQIDCSNHDQVINGLELKSKDLYFFWKNYQWLYNRYYSEKGHQRSETNNAQYLSSLRASEEEIKNLQRQNKRLKIDNQTLRKQVQVLSASSGPNRIQVESEQTIDRLNKKCFEYESIMNKHLSQIMELKKQLKARDNDHEDLQNKQRRQARRLEDDHMELQKKYDELRRKQLQNENGSSVSHVEEQLYIDDRKYRRQLQKYQSIIHSIDQKAIQIIQEQFQATKTDLLQSFPSLIGTFAQGDLQHIIIQEMSEL